MDRMLPTFSPSYPPNKSENMAPYWPRSQEDITVQMPFCDFWGQAGGPVLRIIHSASSLPQLPSPLHLALVHLPI